MAESMTESTDTNDGMKTLVSIMLRRTGGLYTANGAECVPAVPEAEQIPDLVLMAFQANALAWNYIIDPQTIKAIKETVPDVSYLQMVLDVMADSRSMADAKDADVTPMYPDFPRQVAEASDKELITNAIMHYMGDALGVRIMPDLRKTPRVQLGLDAKRVAPTVIKETVDQNDVRETADALLTAPTAWSRQDREDLAVLVSWGYNTFGGGERVEAVTRKIREEGLKQRENKAWLVARPFDGNAEAVTQAAKDVVDLPSDVMKIAVIWANDALGVTASNDKIDYDMRHGIGAVVDVDLDHPSKFKLTRAQRREIVELLAQAMRGMTAGSTSIERAYDRIEDQFARDRRNWLKLTRALHVHELIRKGQADPMVLRWFLKLWAGDCKSMDSKVEALMRRLTVETGEAKDVRPKDAKDLDVAGDDAMLKALADGGVTLQTVDGVTRLVLSEDVLAKTAGDRTASHDVKDDAVDLDSSGKGASTVDAHAAKETLRELIELLKQNPGSYARRLVELLRKTKHVKDGGRMVLDGFAETVPKVSTRVLVEIWNLMRIPAGNTDGVPERKSVVLASGKMVPLPVTIMDDVTEDQASEVLNTIRTALEGRNKGLGWTLAVEDGVSYAMPLSTRFASGGRTAGRGTRVKLEDYDPTDPNLTIRMFVHWRDLDESTVGHDSEDVPNWYDCNERYDHAGRVDLDLSTTTAAEDLKSFESVWYGNLKSSEMTHSGDITSAPHGACEYIDVNVSKALESGKRYMIPTVHSFSGQTFDTIPEAFAGVMIRQDDPQAGEVFEPTTVLSRFDLDRPSTNVSPFVFDLKTGELIWLDAVLPSTAWRSVGDDRNTNATLAVVDSLVNSRPMTVLQLAVLTGAVDKVVGDVDPETKEFLRATGVPLDETGRNGGTESGDDVVRPWQAEKTARLLG